MKILILLISITFIFACNSKKKEGISLKISSKIDKKLKKDITRKYKVNKIEKIITPFFKGVYIIKPLWAFSEGKGNEDGENELYFKIIVDGIEQKTSFQQDKNLSNFNEYNFEFNLKKDSMIIIELWDADAFADDLLLKRVGIIPADLNNDGILYLKDKYSKLEVLFIPKPPISISNNYDIFSKSIMIKKNIINQTIDYPMIFNHKFYQKANEIIGKKLSFLINKYDTSKEITSKIIFKNDNYLSLKFGSIDSKCDKNCFKTISLLTYSFKDSKILTSKELFFKNSYNSNSLCKIINKEEKNEILNCDHEKNKVVNFNNFLLTEKGILFFIKEFKNKEVLINFKELRGLVDKKTFFIKNISKKEKLIKLQNSILFISLYLDNLLAEGRLNSNINIDMIPLKFTKGISDIGFITITSTSLTYTIKGELNEYLGSLTLDENGKKDKSGKLYWIKL